MKVLLIEDEAALSDSIRISLQKEQISVEVASNFEQAMEKIHFFDYDCILLDLTLPDGNGLEILKALKLLTTPSNVLIISARDSLDDKLTGLDLGADDYIAKPFHLAELTARIKAVMRRKNYGGKDIILISNVSLDLKNRQVNIDNKEVVLNRKEFDILSYFMSNQTRLITKSALAEHVWGDHYEDVDNYDFIYYQIKNLRKKLTEAQANIDIQAVYGVGYKLILL